MQKSAATPASPPVPPISRLRAAKGLHKSRIVDSALLLGLLGLFLLLAYRLFTPVFPAMLWGLLLSIICSHPYQELVRMLGGRRILADLLFGSMLVVVLLLPALFFAWELTVNFSGLTGRLAAIAERPLPALPDWVLDRPTVGPAIASFWANATANMTSDIPVVMRHVGSLATWAISELGDFAAFLLQFTLGSVIALFLLHNLETFVAFLSRFFTRIGGEVAERMVLSAFTSTRAVFAGVILAAIAQTILASIAIYVVGLPVVLFAGLTFLLALVQVGSFIVLLAAAGTLLLQGDYLAAVGVAAWFLIVVASVDNVIKPYFSSRATTAPPLLSFLATLGGLISWGLIGVFVGPVLVSILFDLMCAWLDAESDPASAPPAAPDP